MKPVNFETTFRRPDATMNHRFWGAGRMCGFIGVIGSDSAVHEIYDGLVAIQHRGQDCRRDHHLRRRSVPRQEGRGARPGHLLGWPTWRAAEGEIGVGHVRYPTVGSGGGEDAQPFTVNYPFGIVMAHNGNVANYEERARRARRRGPATSVLGCDVEVVLNVFANALAEDGEGRLQLDAYHAAVAEACLSHRVRGAYSVVGYIAGHGMFAFPRSVRHQADRHRETAPECTADGRLCRGLSESVVLDTIGYERAGPGDAGASALHRHSKGM